MVRDITIGQYYPAESRIHRLDPRVKIVCTLFFLISLFIQNSLLGYVVATIFLGAVIHLSKVPLKYIVKGLKPVVILLLFTVAMNLFLTRGGETLVHFWIFTITESGLRTSVFMAVRLMYLVAGSSIMTFTTTPNSLTDGIEKLLHPLNKVHVPVHEVAMMMSIALRFIPILLEETDKIMKAQMARGADFESGNLIQRAKAMIPILVPPGKRPGYGNGGPLLSRRGGPDQDEASEISRQRPGGLPGDHSLCGNYFCCGKVCPI